MTEEKSLINNIVNKLEIYKEEQISEILNRADNPNILTFETKKDKKPITIPIWTFIHDNKFYIFSSKKSKKDKSIEYGNKDVLLLIINTELFLHPKPNHIPYIGIKAKAKIVSHSDNELIPKIHQHLLKKYDPKLSYDWIKKMYNKMNENPEKAWLIEIDPISFYSY